MRVRPAPLVATLLLATVPACHREAPDPGPKWPDGTVMVLEGVPITAAEVDLAAQPHALLEPDGTPLYLRRMALVEDLFPRIAARAIDPQARARAGERARACREALLRGDAPGPDAPAEVERKGLYHDIGVGLWAAALDLPADTWSPVIETPGAFHVLRVKKREEASHPAAVRFILGSFEFPYLDAGSARADIEASLDRSKLLFIDDSWRETVPLAWRHRLRAEP